MSNSNNLTMSEEQKQRLGDKYISEGTAVTDNDTQTKYRICRIEDDGIVLKEASSFSNHPKNEIKVSFDEFLKKYDEQKISVTGYTHELSDQIIIHQVVKDIETCADMGKLRNEIGELSTEETEFKTGGVTGKIKYNKAGSIKDIKNNYGKSIKEVMWGGKAYTKDSTSKTYKNEGGDILKKEHAGEISISKSSSPSEYKAGARVKKSQNSDSTSRIIEKETYGRHHKQLVQKLLENEIYSEDEIRNQYNDENSETKTIVEWVMVSDWLAEKLDDQNEPILMTPEGNWWGRSSDSDSLYDDRAIVEISKHNYEKAGKIESAKNKPQDEGYQGWKNYETWNVKLWIDNEEGSQRYWDERATEISKESKKDEYSTKKEVAVRNLAMELEDYFSDNNPLEGQASTYSDILSAGLSEVSWREIAENLLSDKKECGGEAEVVVDDSEMKTGGKVDVTKNFYRFRKQSPKGATECAVPQWAQKVAGTVKKGAKVTTCKKDGEWSIQSIMIPKEGVTKAEATRMDAEIDSKFSRKKKALGGVAETCTCDEIEKTIEGLEALRDTTDNESEKKRYQELINDLN